MKVTVIGKEAVSGTSKKTGLPFSANVVYFAYPKNGVEGSASDSAWLSQEKYPLAAIQVGKQYSLDYDNRGYLVSFDPV